MAGQMIVALSDRFLSSLRTRQERETHHSIQILHTAIKKGGVRSGLRASRNLAIAGLISMRGASFRLRLILHSESISLRACSGVILSPPNCLSCSSASRVAPMTNAG